MVLALITGGFCAASAGTAPPCPGDAAHTIDDVWICDDGCNTCRCAPDGSIEASGCPSENYGASVDTAEASVVQFAVMAVIACFAIFVLLCGVMTFCSERCSCLMKKDAEGEEEVRAPIRGQVVAGAKQGVGRTAKRPKDSSSSPKSISSRSGRVPRAPPKKGGGGTRPKSKPKGRETKPAERQRDRELERV